MIDELTCLSPADAAILRHVAALALSPRAMTAAHLTALRQVGLDDRHIHDITHVVCCFSYMNRLADGLGVALTESRHAVARELLGEAALAAHGDWAEVG